MGTSELLDELSKIGRPRVSRTNKGNWYACVEFPAPKGITAEVTSDFNHPTHTDALECVMRRLGDMRAMLAGDTITREIAP